MTINDILGLAFDALWATNKQDREDARKVLADALEEAGFDDKAQLARAKHLVYTLPGDREHIEEAYVALRTGEEGRSHTKAVSALIDLVVEEAEQFDTAGERDAWVDAMAFRDDCPDVWWATSRTIIVADISEICEDIQYDYEEDNTQSPHPPPRHHSE